MRKYATLGALEAYLHDRPDQAVTIRYFPKGAASHIGDDPRKWQAILAKPLGSKCGYVTETFEELIGAIVNEAL